MKIFPCHECAGGNPLWLMRRKVVLSQDKRRIQGPSRAFGATLRPNSGIIWLCLQSGFIIGFSRGITSGTCSPVPYGASLDLKPCFVKRLSGEAS